MKSESGAGEHLPLKFSNKLLLPLCALALIAGTVTTFNALPQFFLVRYNSYALLSAFEIFGNLGLMVALCIRKGYVQARIWLALVIAGNIMLGIGELMMRLSVTPQQATLWANFGTIGIMVIPVGFYMFSQFFIGKVSRSREVVMPASMLFTGSVLLAFTAKADTPKLIANSVGFWGYAIPISTQFLILTMWLGLVVILGVLGFIRHLKSDLNAEQQSQIKSVILGVTGSFIGGLILDVFPRYLGLHILPVGVLCQTILPLTLIYSIYRYETFDIDFSVVGADILDSLSEAIVITDSRFKILRINSTGIKITGYSGNVLTQGTIGKLFSPENFISLKTAIKDSGNNGVNFTHQETIMITASGESKTVSLDATELPGSGHSYAFTITDITKDRRSYIDEQERNRDLEAANQAFRDQQLAMMNLLEDSRDLGEQLAAEKENVEHKVDERTAEVKAERLRLEASINSLNVGFIIIDSKGHIITANQAFTDIVGPGKDKKAATISQLAIKLGHSYDIHKAIDSCLAHGHRTNKDELQLDAKVVRIFMAPIFEDDQAHKSLGVVILVEDVTEAKAVERSRDEFFSIASHELRTPLTAIRGNTQMIKEYYKEALSDPDLAEMVNDIHDSSIRLITIVNDFLDTSRLEQGKIAFQLTNFDCKELVDEVVKEFKAGDVSPELYIRVEAPPEPLPFVRADRDRLKQTIYNLIGNGLKFTEKGGLTIGLSTSNKKIKIQVTDTGKGIPVGSQGLLFRKFQQASNNILTRDSTRSTGLGLYISKLIATSMGGKIFLESSTVGKGSTFAIEMPTAGEKIKRLDTAVDTMTNQ